MAGTPAVVIPADRPAALGIARSLGRRGIAVHAIDADPRAIGMASRYVKRHPLPAGCQSEEQRLQFLLEIGTQLGHRAVLYPVSDEAVLLCSMHRDELQKHFSYVTPDHATTVNLLTKDGLHREAQALGIPDPQVLQVTSEADIERARGSIPFPVILKPAFSPAWARQEIIAVLRKDPLSGAPKVALCQTYDELLATYRKLAVYDGRLLIQEVVPGEDDRLVYICFYLNRQAEPLALFAGQKLRVLPVGFGSATYVRSFHDPALEEIALRLLSGVHYQGLGGIEFKKDTRDDRYKLIEFNARLGMWDSFGARCGVDLPYIAYCDALGERLEPQRRYREGVFWIDFQRDLRAFLIYRRQGRLSFLHWVRSMRVEKEWAFYARDDWKPALSAGLKLLQRPWQSLTKWVPGPGDPDARHTPRGNRGGS